MPGSTAAALKTAPSPVVIPQPSSESWSSGRSVSTGKSQLRGTRIFSAYVPPPPEDVTSSPFGPVGDVRLGHDEIGALVGPAARAPVADAALGRARHDRRGRRPGRRVTSAPTSSTTPTPAWPRIVGSLLPSSPRWFMQSVTQKALAVVRTIGAVRGRRQELDVLDDERLAELLEDRGLHRRPPGTRSIRARLCAARRDITRLHADGDLGGTGSPVRLAQVTTRSDYYMRFQTYDEPDGAAADGLLLLGGALSGGDDSRRHGLGPGGGRQARADSPPRAASRHGAARDPAGHGLPPGADAPALGPRRQPRALSRMRSSSSRSGSSSSGAARWASASSSPCTPRPTTSTTCSQADRDGTRAAAAGR